MQHSSREADTEDIKLGGQIRNFCDTEEKNKNGLQGKSSWKKRRLPDRSGGTLVYGEKKRRTQGGL